MVFRNIVCLYEHEELNSESIGLLSTTPNFYSSTLQLAQVVCNILNSVSKSMMNNDLIKVFCLIKCACEPKTLDRPVR